LEHATLPSPALELDPHALPTALFRPPPFAAVQLAPAMLTSSAVVQLDIAQTISSGPLRLSAAARLARAMCPRSVTVSVERARPMHSPAAPLFAAPLKVTVTPQSSATELPSFARPTGS